MANFAYYFNNNFAGCRCLAHAYDEHRKRDVRIYLIPGEIEAVGVTDGVDKWVAPTCISPFSVDIPDLIKRIVSGEDVRTPVMAPRIQSQQNRARRVLVTEDGANPPPSPRRRLLVDPGQPEAPVRHRVTLN